MKSIIFQNQKLMELKMCILASHCIKSRIMSQNKLIQLIDTATSFCACYVGLSEAPCKHQFLVSKDFHIPLQFLVSDHTATKIKYLKIAYGDTADLPPDWYNDLIPKEPCLSIVAGLTAVTSSSESVDNFSVETVANKKQSEQFDLQKNEQELKLVFED